MAIHPFRRSIVAAVGLILLVTACGPVSSTPTQPASAAASPTPTAVPLAVAQQEYLAAVAQLNSALSSLQSQASAAQTNGTCLCSTALIPVRDGVKTAIAAMVAMQKDVPASAAPDLAAEIADLQAVLVDLNAIVAASSEASVAVQEGDLISRLQDPTLAAKIRSDLGLPPPPSV